MTDIQWMGNNPQMPSVEVERGVDEETQVETFANSTLKSTPDSRWAVSVAVYLPLPDRASELEVMATVRDILTRMAEAVPEPVLFDVKVGKTTEHDEMTDEMVEDMAREALGHHDDDDLEGGE